MQNIRVIKLKEVKAKTALSKTTIYKYMKLNKFPKNIVLGERAVAWVESEINNWIQSKIEAQNETVYRKAS